jgi:RHS repeat-associated protein
MVHDRTTTLTYDVYDHLTEVRTDGASTAQVAHTYAADNLRIATITAPGMPGAKTQYWFTEDCTEHDGVRDHYVRVGNRIVARVSFQPPPGGAGAVPTSSSTSDTRRADAGGPRLPIVLVSLALATGLVGFIVLGGRRRRGRRWAPAGATLAALSLVLVSCQMLGGGGTERAAASLWTRLSGLYMHQTLSVGPSVVTNDQGTLFEERRYDPFGQPIESFHDGMITNVDFAREAQNSLGKMSDPTTGWSYHGARWLAPQVARWLVPDPLVKAPSQRHLVSPWDLNPYSYVKQSPTQLWDPDGADWSRQEYADAEQAVVAKGIEHPTNEETFNQLAQMHLDRPEAQAYLQAHQAATFWEKAPWKVLEAAAYIEGGFGLIRGIKAGVGTVARGARAIFGFATRGAPKLLSQFAKSTVDDVVASAGRLRPGGQISEGARALAKKLGHAESGGYSSAFAGVRPTQANAEAIIRGAMESPAHTFYGDKVIDVYNAAGQGVRFDRETSAFMGFLERSLATQ